MVNHARSTLIAIIGLLLVIGLPLGAILLASVWISVEILLVCKRLGKRGSMVFACVATAVVTFLIFQGYALWSNHQLIAAIESQGASSAAMSGRLLPGRVNYISLGDDIGDRELESILVLEGLDHLEDVVANGSQITDAGLQLLHRFEQLRHVYINADHVTQDGVDQLERALPNCLVVYDPDG